jgi:hypothetical protein
MTMTAEPHDDTFFHRILQRLKDENPGLPRKELRELFHREIKSSCPADIKKLAERQLEREAEWILEIADMVEEFRAAGCDLDPENIAEEIFANHKEGLSDEPSEDGGFFFYFVRRELTEEVANYITATKRMMPRIL